MYVLWCSNNSIEVNVLEICEKEQFKWEEINDQTSETGSAAGQVAAGLQEQTYRAFQRYRQWVARQARLHKQKMHEHSL